MTQENIITLRLIEEFQNWTLLDSSRDTATSYAATLVKYCLNEKIISINRKDFFVELRDRLEKGGWTLATISRHTFAVKKFLRFLNEKYDFPIINLNVIKCRKARPKNPIYLERNEIVAIRELPIHTLIELRDRTLFEFLLYTGCRISEALKVEWGKIDFQKGEVEVTGKGLKSRVVFISRSKEWILDYLKKRNSNSPYLFLNQYGKPLARGHSTVAIRHLGIKAKLNKKIHPHILRHTFGTYLIWAGVDPKTVQEMMGHNDLETTLKYYAAVNQERMRQAHSELGNYISNPQPTPAVNVIY